MVRLPVPPIDRDNAPGRVKRSDNPDHPTGWYDRRTGKALPRPRDLDDLRGVDPVDMNLTEVTRWKARHWAVKGQIKSLGTTFTSDDFEAKLTRLERKRQAGEELTKREERGIESARKALGYFKALETIVDKMDVSRDEARERFGEFFDQLARGKATEEARADAIYAATA